MKNLLPKLALAGVVIVVCLLLLEGAVRLIVEPVNFLRPEMVPDPILRQRVEPESAGHDEWGFRNPGVPDSVQIVAIGDSQTYGNAAAALYSWPAWLERLSGRSVYNLGLGGYGPYEYLHLLESKALGMSPDQVVVGFYFGNDLSDAQRSVYGVEHWASQRDPNRSDLVPEPADPGVTATPIEGDGARGSPGKSLRNWLRSSSVLYRWVTLSFGDLLRPFELRYFYRSDTEYTIVFDEDGDLFTSLMPLYRHRGMNLADQDIREGLELGMRALSQMARICRVNDIDFLVLLIPTKVSVFAERAKALGATAQEDIIDRVVADEEHARLKLSQFLDVRGIRYVDVLPDLRGHIGERIYPRTPDGHPTKNGYRLIAEAARRALAAGHRR